MHLQAAGTEPRSRGHPSLGKELARAGQCPRRGHIDGHLLARFSSVFVLFKTASLDVDALMLSYIWKHLRYLSGCHDYRWNYWLPKMQLMMKSIVLPSSWPKLILILISLSLVGIDILQIPRTLFNGRLSWKTLLIHSPHLFSSKLLISSCFPSAALFPVWWLSCARYWQIPFFKAKVLHGSVELEVVPSTEATRSLFLPHPKSPFHFPNQISWVSPVPIFWITFRKKGRVGHFEWSVLCRKEKM